MTFGKSLRCPLKISCFLVPRHSPQLTSRWSARTLWKMSWTFLKQQTKSAQESRSTFHNLLCKVTGMGPLAAQQQMAKLLLESTLCLVPDELGVWVAHFEESLEGNGSTAIPKPNFSRSGPQFRALDQSCHFCCFLFPGVEESIIITALSTHFLSEMLEGRHPKLQIHQTWCKSVLTWRAWP